jgi:hypothetical protein
MNRHFDDCDGTCERIDLGVRVGTSYAGTIIDRGVMDDALIVKWGKSRTLLHLPWRCWLMELLSHSDYESDQTCIDPESYPSARAAGRAHVALKKAAIEAGIDIGRWER